MRRRLPRAVTQSGSPRPVEDRRARRATTARGVVLAVTYPDSDGARPNHTPGVTCDVMTWSRMGVGHLFGVPVMQRGSSVGNGSLWVPRAATQTLDGTPFSVEGSEDGTVAACDPENMDGEWVVIEFFEGDPGAPVIIGSMPHPRSRRVHSGVGSTRDPMESGIGPQRPGRIERFVSHQGTVIRMDYLGSVAVDTTGAPKSDAGQAVFEGVGGHVDVDLRPGAAAVLRFGGVPRLRLTQAGGAVEVAVLSGAVRIEDESGEAGETVLLGGRTLAHLGRMHLRIDEMARAIASLATVQAEVVLPGIATAQTAAAVVANAAVPGSDVPGSGGHADSAVAAVAAFAEIGALPQAMGDGIPFDVEGGADSLKSSRVSLADDPA